MPTLVPITTSCWATRSGSRRRGHQPLGEHGRVGCRAQLDLDHRELVAAEARDRVATAHGGRQALGDGAQELVTRAMAEAVVDLLEAVEVEIEQSDPASRPRRHGKRLDQAVLEQAAIGQAGEHIVMGQMFDPGPGFLGPRQQLPRAARLTEEQEHHDRAAGEQPDQRDPAGGAQITQVLLQGAMPGRRSLEDVEHQPLQRRRLGGQSRAQSRQDVG